MPVREVPRVTEDKRLGAKEKVVAGLGEVAMTETREDDAGQRSMGDTWSSSKEVEVSAHCGSEEGREDARSSCCCWVALVAREEGSWGRQPSRGPPLSCQE